MNLYIWDYMNAVTRNYHDGGGVLIVSHHSNARTAWEENFPDYEGDYEEPNHTIVTVGSEAPRLIIFPDGGCC